MDNNVNKRINELCKEKGWSEYKLAKESGMQNSSINAMLKHNHIPSIPTLEKICAAFDITLSQFFDSELFQKSKTPLFIELWDKLDSLKKEKVLIYIHGLLSLPISKEDLENDI